MCTARHNRAIRRAPDPVARNAIELLVANDHREIPLAAARIDALCVQSGLAPEIAFVINLAVDELRTNTISYGYDDDREHRIEPMLRFNGDEAIVQMADDGEPFYPLQVPDANKEASL